MSRNRNDLHKAKLRRERIRIEKAKSSVVPPSPAAPETKMPRFAAERAMREVHAALEGQEFTSIEDVNARLAQLTSSGDLSRQAKAWKQDDPKWRAQELVYEAEEAEDLGEVVELIKRALDLDPNCTDAQRMMVEVLPMDLENRIHLMKETVVTAERNFGEAFMSEHAGNFWRVLETRPYMRALLRLATYLEEVGNYKAAILIYERMLELNSDDSQGIRFSLLAAYLTDSRPGDALGILTGICNGEERVLGRVAWPLVIAHWQRGDIDLAAKALEDARRVNRHVEPYLAGLRATPTELPETYQPGRESEAEICAIDLAPAVERHRDFRTWLKQNAER